MPPAKSDLRSLTGIEQRDDGITRASSFQREGGGSSSSVSAKVACLACRKIKVRCLMPPDASSSSSPPSQSIPCLRCARLEIECLKTPHRKGGRPERARSQIKTSTSGESQTSPAETKLEKVALSSLYDRMAEIECEGRAAEVEEEHMITDPPSRLKDHSIKAILDSDDGQAMHRLHDITVKRSLSEKNTASTSLRPTPLGSARKRPSARTDVVDIVRQGIFSLSEVRQLHAL